MVTKLCEFIIFRQCWSTLFVKSTVLSKGRVCIRMLPKTKGRCNVFGRFHYCSRPFASQTVETPTHQRPKRNKLVKKKMYKIFPGNTASTAGPAELRLVRTGILVTSSTNGGNFDERTTWRKKLSAHWLVRVGKPEDRTLANKLQMSEFVGEVTFDVITSTRARKQRRTRTTPSLALKLDECCFVEWPVITIGFNANFGI